MTRDQQYQDALEAAGYIVEAVEDDAYNCECQVGGVDAMSIDTDWLRHNIHIIYKYLSGEED